MKLQPAPKIALLVETSRSYGRELLRGVSLFARTRSNWSLLHQERTLDAAPPRWLKSSGISGVIARVDKRTLEPLKRLGVPVVDVRCSLVNPGIPQVETDDRAVAELAFEHLWERGFRRFAFCGYESAHYSEARLRHFRHLVERAGSPLSIYKTPSDKKTSLVSIEQSGVTDVKRMSQWLRTLAPPTGMLVCNDIRGQQVLNACGPLGIDVPDDLGVIGVDDDEAICLLSEPQLSSVRPNAEQVGYHAAEILHQFLAGTPPRLGVEYVPPVTVVQRLSTQVSAVDDREVARICRFIRQHAGNGINVSDIERFTSLSRRQLERRIRSELGRTLRQEITLAQIAIVKRLLLETSMTLEQIAPLAGYDYPERLCAVFKRETGETPSDFRRRSSDGSRLVGQVRRTILRMQRPK